MHSLALGDLKLKDKISDSFKARAKHTHTHTQIKQNPRVLKTEELQLMGLEKKGFQLEVNSTPCFARANPADSWKWMEAVELRD